MVPVCRHGVGVADLDDLVARPLVPPAPFWHSAPDADVSVILPTYNEVETIVEVIADVVAELALEPYEFEVLVVDDDSPDGTARIVREHYRDMDRVEVLRRTRDRGLSSAVLDGLRFTRGRYAVVMDADGQHPAEELPELLDALQDADVVVGSRHVDGGSIEGWPVSRVITSKVATLLARGLVPAARQLTDV